MRATPNVVMSIKTPKRIKLFIDGKTRRVTLFCAPGKGQWAWEAQVGPIVLHWMYQGQPRFRGTRGVGRFCFWFDSAWMR